MIADLTEGNPNVFYELAIRHGIKKPFVHITDSSEPIPFDNAQVRTIQIDLADLDSVDLAKKELEKQVSTIESDKHVVESPISIAFDLESLKASGNTDQSLLASLYREVLSVKSDVRDLRRQNTKKPLSSKSIRSLEDIYIVLRNEGESDLNELLSKATFHTVEPNNVSLSTSYTVDEDRFIEERLGAVLRRVTGEHWQVDVLPF